MRWRSSNLGFMGRSVGPMSQFPGARQKWVEKPAKTRQNPPKPATLSPCTAFSAIGNRNSQFAIRNFRAFSLVEVLVVVSLLSLIVLALMNVFNATQQAFRASVTQTDVLEGSRATVEMMTSDLRQLSPSGGISNVVGTTVKGAVNFFSSANYNNYLPLTQSLPGSFIQRTNLLNWFFVLSRQNTKWVGVGYVVDNTNSSLLYPLYRYYRNDLSVRSDPLFLFQDFTSIVYGSQWTNANVSHVMDGVVHLVVRGFDTNGTWINNNRFPPYTNAQNVLFFPPAWGESQCYFFSNTVPAAVELQLGVLEDRILARAESLPNNLPALPPNDRRSLYLNGVSGNVHLFRQRVTIQNVDPAAYQ